jgi:hypothetical protein
MLREAKMGSMPGEPRTAEINVHEQNSLWLLKMPCSAL